MIRNQDIEKREDIENLVDDFYVKAIKDEVIGYFFTKVTELDFNLHIPLIVDFWEGILLGSMLYQGNPMLKHIELSKKATITKLHFTRWLLLWEESVDSLFQGEKATLAKSRADQIAQLMQHKIEMNK